MAELSNVIGLRELVSCGSFPGFVSGIKNTRRRALGIHPVVYTRFARVVSGLVSSDSFLYTSGGSLSGPGAFLGVRKLMALVISALVTILCGRLVVSQNDCSGASSLVPD